MMRNLLLASLGLFSCISSSVAESLKVATFNVSMESSNYAQEGETPSRNMLISRLATGRHPQIRNIAEIIQRVRPDILLLNEFDYVENPRQGVERFIYDYLAKSQNQAEPIHYPHYFYQTVNTGQPSPFDLNNDGKKEGVGADAFGFGYYPGHYGMVILSKYPIARDKIRTFQHFRWKDMPEARKPLDPATGQPWFNQQEWDKYRLSSKSHWDVPVLVKEKWVHILAAHPTPPVFDGEEDRNGKRNYDEVRLWADYLTPGKDSYIYDDDKRRKGLGEDKRFVIVGDLNASAEEGGANKDTMVQLLQHPRVNDPRPTSKGAIEDKPENPHAPRHTAHWGMRADYALPSRYGFDIVDKGVFWPEKAHPLYRLIENREASSDHRLVWVELTLTDEP